MVFQYNPASANYDRRETSSWEERSFTRNFGLVQWRRALYYPQADKLETVKAT